ncbi:MAG: folate family ECF transporter S component [Lachnospiraceae bacterium]|nr:folate family ECF transporter S component [Lachnospiraceae bacterium]
MTERSRQLFRFPISKAYWKLALSEVRNVRVMTIAGVLLALRIAIKPLSIPIPLSQDLYFSFDFIVNSVASMIAGPIVSMICGAISDTLGAILFPKGPYFFPYIFQEMASSLIFALFYYRANLSSLRVILGRFFVSLICNIGLGAWIGYYYYQTFYPKSLAVFGARQAAGIVKNLALFPLEAVVLLLLFGALVPLTNKMQLTFTGQTKFGFHKKEVILLIILTIVAVAAIALYVLYKLNGGK